jgi:hypothetical protein
MNDRAFRSVLIMLVVTSLTVGGMGFYFAKRETRLRAECEANDGVFIMGRGLQCIPKEKFR